MSSQSNAALEQILGQEDAKFVEGIVWLVNHEAWARDVFNRGFDAGWQDAMNMGLRNAEGTYSSLINEAAITSQRPSGSPYPHIFVHDVYTDAYDSGYVNAMWELNKVNPGAGARLNALNGAAKIDRDKEPLAFASWERKMALHMQGYDGPSMEAAAALGLAVLSGIAPTAAMLKQPKVAAKTSGSSVGATGGGGFPTSKVVLGLAAVGVGAVLIKSAFSLQAALEPGPLRQGACQVEAPGAGDSYSKSSYGAANILRNRDDVGAVVFEVNGEGWYVSDLLNNSGPMSKEEALRRANQEVAWGRFREWGGPRNRIACAQPDGSFVSLPAKV